jgi:hypothetical protein
MHWLSICTDRVRCTLFDRSLTLSLFSQNKSPVVCLGTGIRVRASCIHRGYCQEDCNCAEADGPFRTRRRQSNALAYSILPTVLVSLRLFTCISCMSLYSETTSLINSAIACEHAALCKMHKMYETGISVATIWCFSGALDCCKLGIQ